MSPTEEAFPWSGMVSCMAGDRRLTPGEYITHTWIEPDSTTAEYAFLELIAEHRGEDIETLPPLYDEVDHFLETLFTDPPSEQAQLGLEFSYCGFRVRIDQSGHVTLLRLAEGGE